MVVVPDSSPVISTYEFLILTSTIEGSEQEAEYVPLPEVILTLVVSPVNKSISLTLKSKSL